MLHLIQKAQDDLVIVDKFIENGYVTKMDKMNNVMKIGNNEMFIEGLSKQYNTVGKLILNKQLILNIFYVDNDIEYKVINEEKFEELNKVIRSINDSYDIKIDTVDLIKMILKKDNYSTLLNNDIVKYLHKGEYHKLGTYLYIPFKYVEDELVISLLFKEDEIVNSEILQNELYNELNSKFGEVHEVNQGLVFPLTNNESITNSIIAEIILTKKGLLK